MSGRLYRDPHPRVDCPACGGHGLVGVWVGDYDIADCSECNGLGQLVVYPNDGLALWPGGPMRGSWPGKYAELRSLAHVREQA